MQGKVCGSCKKKVINDRGSVEFPCPGCSENMIVRCSTCRSNATKYHCSCGFVGPN